MHLYVRLLNAIIIAKLLLRLTHCDTPSSTTHYYTRLAYIHSKKKDNRQRLEDSSVTQLIYKYNTK